MSTTVNNVDKDSTTGVVLSIHRASMHDGPGIRTTVFLKGCPLRCLWCHNPESQSFTPELLWTESRCTACGRCTGACPNHALDNGPASLDRSRCVRCGDCVEACYTGALEIVGREMTVAEAMADVLADRTYYETSGGGMTLSGGEPLAQFEFSMAMLRAAKDAGIHTCVDTCAFVRTERMLAAAEVTDLFLIDWKHTDSGRHKEYTGVDNELIRTNIVALDDAGAKSLFRCPIIPGLNDREEHLRGIAELVNGLHHVQGVEVLAYHPLGESKSDAMGKSYPLQGTPFTTAEQLAGWCDTLRKYTDVPLLNR